jgi:hypothetical protein
MKFENGKVAHEHVWWDQASLLVQVGLLNPANLPVAGVEQAKEFLRIAAGQKAHAKASQREKRGFDRITRPIVKNSLKK